MSEPSVAFGSVNYTHAICGLCGSVLYCSEAKEWNGTGYGWCPHEDGPGDAVFTDYPDKADMLHRCNGEMRPWTQSDSHPALPHETT